MCLQMVQNSYILGLTLEVSLVLLFLQGPNWPLKYALLWPPPFDGKKEYKQPYPSSSIRILALF